MGWLQSWWAAVRRSPVPWAAAGVVLIATVVGGVLLGTRASHPPAPAPTPSVRAVALGDSVPYGHGLANPYLTPQIGLPTNAVSQGPSALAYPSRVADAFGLTMTVRPTNCHLEGDQLSISGAVADPADNPTRDGQCPNPPQQARNLGDEIAASGLAAHPAHLVLLQDGADDIHFADCLEYELARVLGTNLGLGTDCLTNGALTPALTTELSRVRTSVASAIEQVAPHTATVAVLNYYQPIPQPGQIASGTSLSGSRTNLVCTGLKENAASTSAAADVVLTALNRAVSGAVADARAHGVHNVDLIDVSHAFDGHGICTADPWAFSSEPVPDTTLAADAEHILAAKACDAAHDAVRALPCASETASADQAEQTLKGYVWRAAHPTADGQRALAIAVERALRGRV